MKTIVKILGIILIMSLVFSACAKKFSAEEDFEANPIDGGKAVEITKYVGKEWTISIPPKIKKLPVTHIGERAFVEKNLINVTIPNGVTNIGDAAFGGNQLTSVTIPNSVNSIGVGAFVVNKLTSITIPKSVTEIGDMAFAGNDELTAINVSSGNANYSSTDGVLYNKDRTILIQWPLGRTDAVTIPDNVTSIGASAFAGSKLTSITIPDIVTSIGDNAFIESKLISIIIPDSVNKIGHSAFADSQLTSVTIPDNVEIAYSAFLDVPLTSITIGANVRLGNDYVTFEGGFDRVYNNGGRRAGTYTRPNANSRNWTRQ